MKSFPRIIEFIILIIIIGLLLFVSKIEYKGAIIISIFLAVLIKSLMSLPKKSTRYGFNTIIFILIFFVILAIVYKLVANHNYRVDLTANKVYSLSPQTMSVLKNLNKKVNIASFAENKNSIEQVRSQYVYFSKNLNWEIYDPYRENIKAKKFGENVSPGDSYIYVEDENHNIIKKEKIEGTDEENIVNALIKITRDVQKKIYFLTGHGEHSINKEDSMFKRLIEDEAYKVEELTLSRVSEIPSDCEVLIISGPKVDLFNTEYETIEKYLEEGGRLFVLIDTYLENKMNAENMTKFLKKYGVEVGDDIVVDSNIIAAFGGGNELTPSIMNYTEHPITKGFSNVLFMLPGCRTVSKLIPIPEGVTVMELMKTYPSSWAEKNFDTLVKEGKMVQDENEMKGPLSVAVAVEKSSQQDKKPMRMVVIGDSNFAEDKYLKEGVLQVIGKNLLMNSINWLAGEETLISIRPNKANFTPLTLSASDVGKIFIVFVILIPLIILLGSTFPLVKRYTFGKVLTTLIVIIRWVVLFEIIRFLFQKQILYVLDKVVKYFIT